MVQDRPSTKVHAAPGGGSSLGYLFGGGSNWHMPSCLHMEFCLSNLCEPVVWIKPCFHLQYNPCKFVGSYAVIYRCYLCCFNYSIKIVGFRCLGICMFLIPQPVFFFFFNLSPTSFTCLFCCFFWITRTVPTYSSDSSRYHTKCCEGVWFVQCIGGTNLNLSVSFLTME